MEDYDRTRVCEACSKLDLETKLLEADRHFEGAWKADNLTRYGSRSQGSDYFFADGGGVFMCSFDTRLSSPTTCPLCSFFSSMRIQPDIHTKHKLLALCCTSMPFLNGWKLRKGTMWKEFDHDICLAVLPDVDGMLPDEYGEGLLFHDARNVGFIHRVLSTKPRDVSKLILQPQTLVETIDFVRVGRWISYCADHHGDNCAAPKERDKALKEFRVINCVSNPVSLEIRRFTVRYAALSYVWGHGPEKTWPAVILDAVEVTRKLGLQYLWVDRLCIDQSNPAEKDYLISKMAWIYGCAEVTIVAAAGSDATYGLPGVRSTGRKPQPGIRISPKLALISSMGDPRIAVEESVWSTRGWTYQEGVLSNRRLVFTDEQVYFECHGMSVWESIELPLDLYHSESRSKMDSHVRSGLFHGSVEPLYSTILGVWGFGDELGNNKSPVYQSTLRIDSHIHEFSQRALGYDEDSLIAFSGVIDRLALRGGLRAVLGLPIWAGRRQANTTLRLSFGLSVSFWAHKKVFSPLGGDEFLCMRRRRHLPSWTWAGWEGTITWYTASAVHFLVFSGLVEALETAELGSDLAYAPVMTLQDASRNSLIPLDDVNSLENLADDRLYRLLITDPLILDVNSVTFNPKDIRLHLSIETTRADVLAAHMTGDLISVLTFYGHIEHVGTVAQFIIIAKASSGLDKALQLWERVGKLDLDIWERWVKAADAIQNMPVKQWVDIATIV